MERRNSFRIPVSGEEYKCTLRTSKGSIDGVLEEESAGGFAVLLRLLRGNSVGETGTLKTARGTYQVRVAHITKVSNGDRIGLVRQSELSESQTSTGASPRVSNGTKFKNPLGNSFVVPAIIALVVLLGIAEYCFRSSRGGSVDTTAVSLDRGEAVQRFKALRQITGPASTKHIRLSRTQQKAVINVTHKALGELRILSNSQGRVADEELADLSMQVIYQATDRIHRMLNARQKQVWSDMVQYPTGNAGRAAP